MTAQGVPRQAGMLAAQRRRPWRAWIVGALGAASGYSPASIMHEAMDLAAGNGDDDFLARGKCLLRVSCAFGSCGALLMGCTSAG